MPHKARNLWLLFPLARVLVLSNHHEKVIKWHIFSFKNRFWVKKSSFEWNIFYSNDDVFLLKSWRLESERKKEPQMQCLRGQQVENYLCWLCSMELYNWEHTDAEWPPNWLDWKTWLVRCIPSWYVVRSYLSEILMSWLLTAPLTLTM